MINTFLLNDLAECNWNWSRTFTNEPLYCLCVCVLPVFFAGWGERAPSPGWVNFQAGSAVVCQLKPFAYCDTYKPERRGKQWPKGWKLQGLEWRGPHSWGSLEALERVRYYTSQWTTKSTRENSLKMSEQLTEAKTVYRCEEFLHSLIIKCFFKICVLIRVLKKKTLNLFIAYG